MPPITSVNKAVIISSDNKISLEPWVETLARCFPDFTILTHVSMVGLFLMILVKNTSLNLFDISVHDKELIKLGFMKLANKGAIFIKLKIDYETIGIFNCHLAAGVRTKDFEKRKENLNVLIDYLYKHNDLSSTFIMGDMNFRTKTTCERASKLIDFYIEQCRNQSVGQYRKCLEICV